MNSNPNLINQNEEIEDVLARDISAYQSMFSQDENATDGFVFGNWNNDPNYTDYADGYFSESEPEDNSKKESTSETKKHKDAPVLEK